MLSQERSHYLPCRSLTPAFTPQGSDEELITSFTAKHRSPSLRHGKDLSFLLIYAVPALNPNWTRKQKTSAFQSSCFLEKFSVTWPDHSFHQHVKDTCWHSSCTNQQWGKPLMWRLKCTFGWCSLLSTSVRCHRSWGTSQILWPPAVAAWSPVRRKWSWRRRGPGERKTVYNTHHLKGVEQLELASLQTSAYKCLWGHPSCMYCPCTSTCIRTISVLKKFLQSFCFINCWRFSSNKCASRNAVLLSLFDCRDTDENIEGCNLVIRMNIFLNLDLHWIVQTHRCIVDMFNRSKG